MQSKLGSLAESFTNILIGISVAWVANIIILPLFGYNVTLTDAGLMSIIFTVISLIRSYLVRRLYNKYNFFSR